MGNIRTVTIKDALKDMYLTLEESFGIIVAYRDQLRDLGFDLPHAQPDEAEIYNNTKVLLNRLDLSERRIKALLAIIPIEVTVVIESGCFEGECAVKSDLAPLLAELVEISHADLDVMLNGSCPRCTADLTNEQLEAREFTCTTCGFMYPF